MIFKYLTSREKLWLLLFLSCLFAWWLFLASAICSASGTYQTTEAELKALETRLETLNQISVTQQQESKRLKDTLTKSEQELQTLKSKLDTSTVQLKQAQASLQNANRSLQEYAAEEKRTRLRIKAQRNTWIAATIIACIGLAIK